jgi:mRNA interferase MazF
MRLGRMLKSGDVILTRIQFVDTNEVKVRPALILFEESDNYIVAGITSNTKMKGIPLLKSEGAIKDSIIKLNYIFTVSRAMINKKLFSLNSKKKKLVFSKLVNKLKVLEN